MSKTLENYLRAHRKRTGLTQDEVAFLLGSKSGTKVSRYEKFRRTPTLQTALALTVIFDAPTRELFAGLRQQIERATTARAAELIKDLRSQPQDRATARKLAVLRTICLPRGRGRTV